MPANLLFPCIAGPTQTFIFLRLEKEYQLMPRVTPGHRR